MPKLKICFAFTTSTRIGLLIKKKGNAICAFDIRFSVITIVELAKFGVTKPCAQVPI